MISRRLRQLRKAGKLIWSPVFRKGLSLGVAAAIEHRQLIQALRFNTFVDIGANKGQFSLLVRGLHPECRIYAFEPLARPAALFAKLFDRDPGITLHRCAIGPVSETARMHVSGRDDSSSLLPIGEEQNRFAPGTAEVGTEDVRVVPLGALLRAEDLKAPALLKLDVQGYELEALKGCADLFPAFRYVYVEVSFVELYETQALADEIVAYLTSHDFKWMGVYNLVTDAQSRCIQADLLFGRG